MLSLAVPSECCHKGAFSTGALNASECVLGWRKSQSKNESKKTVAAPRNCRIKSAGDVYDSKDDAVGIEGLKKADSSKDPSS